MNLTLAVVLPLACYTPPERPFVDAPVLQALRGQPVPDARPEVAAALAAIAPVQKRRR